MSRPAALAVLLACMATRALAAQALPAPATAPAEIASARQYVIRADRALSRRLNPVLAQLGAPLRYKLKDGQTPEAYLAGICGYARPDWRLAEDDQSRQTILHAPCLLADKDVEVQVRRGDSIPAIGMHIGILEGALGTLRVVRESGFKAGGASEVHPEDRLIVPDYPAWTPIASTSDIAPDRPSVMKALAGALACNDTETPDECLTRFRVGVIDDTPKPIAPPRPRPKASTGEDHDVAAWIAPSAQDVAPGAGAGAGAGAGEPVPGKPPEAGVQVAKGQWPYDPARIQRLLAGSGAGAYPRQTIAVIDVGLGSSDGLPLPPETFAPADPGASNALRRFGDGVPFRNTGASSVGICEGALSSPTPEALSDAELAENYSHGAVTSSLATGLAFRRARSGVIPAEILPKLLFVRLHGDPCPPSGRARANPSDVIRAVQLISDRVEIVNLSFQDDGAESSGLPDALMNAIRGSEKVLVVAAGNDAAEDLMMSPGQFCPACLANPQYEKGSPAIARRVLAVGAATPSLEVESFSGKGWPAVLLYAPGDAYDAVDVFGRDAPAFEPSTSYAAPKVALALALSRSLVPGATMDRIVKRTLLAAWPAFEVDENAERRRINGGVLDLTKVAAIRTYVVEAFVEEDGHQVLKTYTGPIVTPTKDLMLCANQGFAADEWMGVTLGPANKATKVRELVFYPQYFVDQQFKFRPKPCAPKGVLRINDLVEDEVTLPLEKVILILTPLRE